MAAQTSPCALHSTTFLQLASPNPEDPSQHCARSLHLAARRPCPARQETVEGEFVHPYPVFKDPAKKTSSEPRTPLGQYGRLVGEKFRPYPFSVKLPANPFGLWLARPCFSRSCAPTALELGMVC
jgi:hypothetical protein